MLSSSTKLLQPADNVSGVILYQTMIIYALRLGTDPIDLSFVTAVIVFGTIAIHVFLRRMYAKRRGMDITGESIVGDSDHAPMLAELTDSR